MPTPLLNPHLRAVARWRVGSGVLDDDEFEKVAQPPGMDPGGGGGATMDPAAMAGGMGGGGAPGGAPGGPPGGGMGGAPAPPPGPMDPATLAQITQAVQGAGAGAGGMGPGGKGGGKKAEQQLLDTKLWTIQYLQVKICEALNIQVPPSIVVGPPPDPMMMQQAQTEQAQPGGGGANIQAAGGAGGTPGGAPGGAPGGPSPIPPMDASQGPIGGVPGGGATKAGAALSGLSGLMDEGAARRSFDVGTEYSLSELREVRSKAGALAALSRSLKTGAA